MTEFHESVNMQRDFYGLDTCKVRTMKYTQLTSAKTLKEQHVILKSRHNKKLNVETKYEEIINNNTPEVINTLTTMRRIL